VRRTEVRDRDQSRKETHKSSGVRPVFFARRDSIRGPISSPS
jgi:hypothetical protein